MNQNYRFSPHFQKGYLVAFSPFSTLQNSAVKPAYVCSFFVGKLLITNSVSLDKAIWVINLFLNKLRQFVSLRYLSISSEVIKQTKSCICLLVFGICRVCSNVLFLVGPVNQNQFSSQYCLYAWKNFFQYSSGLFMIFLVLYKVSICTLLN